MADSPARLLPATGSPRARPAARGSGPIRRHAAVGLARLTSGVVGVARHQGTALPGLAAERVWPGSLRALADQLRSTVLVAGTNGKTTTAGLIAEILRQGDARPIANRSGANMRQGIVTSLVRESDMGGRLRREDDNPRDAVFEVDEAALEQVLPELGPCVIVATNLFRDQLDRFGEADAIQDRWATALLTAGEGSILVYCADDPRLAMLASDSPLPTLSFGLAGPPTDRDPQAGAGAAVADPMTCRACDRQLDYAWRSIGHLGAFACPAGHVARQVPDIEVESLPMDVEDHAGTIAAAAGAASRRLRLSSRSGDSATSRSLAGLTNAYNVAAAVTAGVALGRPLAGSLEATEAYDGAFGRLEWIEIDGRHLVLALIKNTVSLAETVQASPGLAADVVLIALNDAPADGRDVSWIWDAPIAKLVAGRAVVLAGSRSTDLQLRLKYDPDVVAAPPRSVEEAATLAAALDTALARTPRGGTIVAAATYTAMMGLRMVAERRGDAPSAPR